MKISHLGVFVVLHTVAVMATGYEKCLHILLPVSNLHRHAIISYNHTEKLKLYKIKHFKKVRKTTLTNMYYNNYSMVLLITMSLLL